jgi:hypothetical protein
VSRDKKSGETVLIKIPKNIIEIENIANVELKLKELIEKQSKFYTFNKYIKPELEKNTGSYLNA